ncbi:MAG: hypothetical protein Q7R87_03300 [Nanoarchaeota archaeon]|nr:hypothetical protein [Nanoarchaeota archaeon]
MEQPNPIISLLIRDANNPKRILIGVRDPITNQTHPNVVSTITGRIPRALETSLFRDVKFKRIPIIHNFPEQVTGAYISKYFRTSKYTGNEEEYHDPIIFAVSSLISNKLCEPQRFSAHVSSIIEGNLFYEKGEEKARMIGIEVLTENAHLFPSRNKSYSSLAWVNEDKFIEMVKSKSTLPVAQELGKDSIMYCVKGLCLLSGYVSIKK